MASSATTCATSGEARHRSRPSPNVCAASRSSTRWGAGPSASINFLTAHDGFTLNDLVTYNERHNEANGENNQDGASDNHSWNHGVEGPTNDPEINALRARQIRNMLATLLLSQGTPMLLAGDEVRRTQKGNNNAYCQDNEISWLDWSLVETNASTLRFVRKLCALGTPQVSDPSRRNRFVDGQYIEELGVRDVTWIRADGSMMEDENWRDPNLRCLGILLDGRAQTIRHPLPAGQGSHCSGLCSTVMLTQSSSRCCPARACVRGLC